MAFRLVWPTQFDRIIQDFGVNTTGVPDFYTRHGLPGHEGLDFVAPTGSEIYACAAGRIKLIANGSDGHCYGVQVRITHATDEGEFETIYAHLQRVREGLRQGDTVQAGELIGFADNTGCSFGPHLHLTLKKLGATANNATTFPRDIINPRPFLNPFNSSAIHVQPQLQDRLSFVADVTIPDDSILVAGAPFTKIWQVRNDGTTTWNADYRLVFIDNTNMAGLTETLLPPLSPGELGTITIAMTAPSRAGRYKSTWRARNPDGNLFGSIIFTLIRVANS